MSTKNVTPESHDAGQPLVSIVIPAYNIAPYIARCLDSVLAQTLKNLEIICVDDGSSDGTGDILDEYAKRDARIQVLHKPNEGVTAARLDGIKASTGDFIGFVDGDDVIDADMYERLVRAILLHSADIAHCGHVMLWDGEIVEYSCTRGRGDYVQAGEEAVVQLLRGEIEPGLCDKLYRRKLFDSALIEGAFDESITNLEDLLMNFYLFRQSAVLAYVDFVPYKYIVRKGSASDSSGKALRLYGSAYKVVRILIKETTENPVLQTAAFGRYVALIMGMAEEPIKSCNADAVLNARKELKIALTDSRFGEIPGTTQKRAKLIAIAPSFYRAIHVCYSTVRGTRSKYERK